MPARHARRRELGRARRRATALVVLASLAAVVAVAVVLSLAPSRRVAGSSPPGTSATTSTSGAGRTTTTTTSSASSDPLEGSVTRLVASRRGRVMVAIQDLRSGRLWTLGPATPQREASVVKVNILVALLHEAQARGVALSPAQRVLATRMIELSDNASATSLWSAAGATSGLATFDHVAGLATTTPSPCVVCAGFPWPGWGLTTTTPIDQIRLLRLLVFKNHLVDTGARAYALGLLEHVTASERWGVSAGVPIGVTVALKNGWLPLDATDTDWQINSIGWVDGAGRDYLLAVLTTGDPSESYGIATIDSIAERVWQRLP